MKYFSCTNSDFAYIAKEHGRLVAKMEFDRWQAEMKSGKMEDNHGENLSLRVWFDLEREVSLAAFYGDY